MAAPDLAAFAGALVHELRTPLTVIAGEVDLALARERSPDAYREALSRIAERVAELVDLTRDFALLGDFGEAGRPDSRTAALDEVFVGLADRYGPRRGHALAVQGHDLERRVAGDAVLLAGALGLLVEHAAKHRRIASQLRLATEDQGDAVMSGTIDLVLTVSGGFSPGTWQLLAPPAADAEPAYRDLRVQTAARIIHGYGGSLRVTSCDGAECVVIRLRRETPPDGSR